MNQFILMGLGALPGLIIIAVVAYALLNAGGGFARRPRTDSEEATGEFWMGRVPHFRQLIETSSAGID
jgi:hypothetical protein